MNLFFEREPFNGKRGREQLRVRGAHTTTRETQRDSHEATGALNALRSIRKELGGGGGWPEHKGVFKNQPPNEHEETLVSPSHK